ncbi:hypothetical protein [Cytobacillus oceanisediminis]|uniref:Uncharacterized protein n=1 Tax=Cytobacillus oceanisediminis TaxID=665099 RepID=A0A562JLF7_9BACI|nr:hypothetical protein [Cytobacillus oceanisediminis]TWH84046.1 hypothetical protein IQ19_03711 [Cytobacillus oceanisediminis]
MKKSRLMPFVLLSIFLSFLITQYPGVHINGIPMDESKAITVSELAESFLLKDDPKKHVFTQVSKPLALTSLAIILFLYSAMHIIARRKKIFYTPIFYEANYVIHTP